MRSVSIFQLRIHKSFGLKNVGLSCYRNTILQVKKFLIWWHLNCKIKFERKSFDSKHYHTGTIKVVFYLLLQTLLLLSYFHYSCFYGYKDILTIYTNEQNRSLGRMNDYA